MDQLTRTVRKSNWINIIQQFQNRPAGTTAKQWLVENGISEKSYCYWLRKTRREVCEQEGLPEATSLSEISFVEIPVKTALDMAPVPTFPAAMTPVAVIRSGGLTLEDGHMVKAKHPKGLLHGSTVSPTLAAAIINGKYVNAIPLYRLEQEFRRYGLAITRQNMANWMIRLGEEYLSVLYDYLHWKLYDYHVIQADETPVLVNRDDRPAGSKSYMWVYRSGYMYPEKQIVLYE